VIDLLKLKARMRKFADDHDLTVPPGFKADTDWWGESAKTLAWRCSGHLRDEHNKQAVLAHTTRASELWPYFYPDTAAEMFRNAMERGYASLIGVREGSAKHAEICRYVGLSTADPWCAGGHWYVAAKLAHFDGPRPANVNWVPTMENYAQAHGIIRGFDRTWLPGMSVTFCWDETRKIGTGDHIGIIDQVKAKGVRLKTIATDEANASNMVRDCERAWGQINCVFDLARLQK
jgi:hypothetical protein